jgi:anti-sigma regulatory factor (Ser/Thr protein kinase)
MAVQPDPAEVGRARRWARSRLLGCGLDPDSPFAEALVLVVSELVTNAVVHTGCPAVLCLLFPVGPDTDARAVRVEVADASEAAPKPHRSSADAVNGRGLELVERLCDRWGWYPDGVGKRVWCELDQLPGAPVSRTGRSLTRPVAV